MTHSGLCISGVCGIGGGITLFTDIITFPLHFTSNPILQLTGAVISIGGIAALIIGMKQ